MASRLIRVLRGTVVAGLVVGLLALSPALEIVAVGRRGVRGISPLVLGLGVRLHRWRRYQAARALCQGDSADAESDDGGHHHRDGRLVLESFDHVFLSYDARVAPFNAVQDAAGPLNSS